MLRSQIILRNFKNIEQKASYRSPRFDIFCHFKIKSSNCAPCDTIKLCKIITHNAKPEKIATSAFDSTHAKESGNT